MGDILLIMKISLRTKILNQLHIPIKQINENDINKLLENFNKFALLFVCLPDLGIKLNT